MRSLPPSRRRPGDVEWLGGWYTLPHKLYEEGVAVQADVVLWLELPRGTIVNSTVINPLVPLAFEETLFEAMKHPAEGVPRRPARIRVPTQQLADALRDSGVPVVVAPVPELDDVFAELAGPTAPPPALTSYLADGVSPDLVRTFFSAASSLFRAAPWRHVTEQQVLCVDIPELQVKEACLTVIGGAGESRGLLLFRSLDAFMNFGSALPPDPDEMLAPRPSQEANLLSLSFDPKKFLPPEMVAEIRAHRWEVAGAKAYPALLAFDAESVPLQLTERSYRIMTACATAFLAFFARHRDYFEWEGTEVEGGSFTTDDDVAVTITPYDLETLEDSGLLDFEADMPDESVPVRQEVGRNDPCPCGSGKKYKKCHLDAGR